MSSSLKQKRAVNRRARQNKRSGLELVVQGSQALVGQEILQPIFPLSSTFDNKVFNVIKSVNLGTITSSTVAEVKTNYSFKFNDVNDTTNLAGVFDQYRIQMVEILFVPRVTENATSTANFGLFAVAPDYDDVANVSTFAALLDYSTATTSAGTNPQRRVIVPHTATAAYGSGAFSSYGNQTGLWIDAAYATVEHYGIKTVWTATSAAASMDVIAKYWLQFKNVR